jgi:hypothetical protein
VVKSNFFSPWARKKEVSRIHNPAEKFGEDPVTTEIKPNKWEPLKNSEAGSI